MRIKSYFAESVSEALERAQRELGPEALLVDSHQAAPESRHLGAWEVVFGLTEDGPAPMPAPGRAAERQPDRVWNAVEDMRRQLEGIERVIARTGLAAPRWYAPSSALAEAFRALIAAEVPGEVAQEVLEAVQARLGLSASAGEVREALELEMARRATADPGLGSEGDEPRAVALVGPPGAGKTTALVKLAMHHGLRSRRPVQILSLDTSRVAAAEQLRSYAAILGVGFQVVETTGALLQALYEHQRKGLILVDTPGHSGADLDDAAELARFLAAHPEIHTHLVLTASMKPADLSRVVDAFAIFRPQRLLFTRLDETGSYGPLFAETARTAKPLSFFGTGQRIPEDLEPATSEGLIGRILGVRIALNRSAA